MRVVLMQSKQLLIGSYNGRFLLFLEHNWPAVMWNWSLQIEWYGWYFKRHNVRHNFDIRDILFGRRVVIYQDLELSHTVITQHGVFDLNLVIRLSGRSRALCLGYGEIDYGFCVNHHGSSWRDMTHHFVPNAPSPEAAVEHYLRKMRVWNDCIEAEALLARSASQSNGVIYYHRELTP